MDCEDYEVLVADVGWQSALFPRDLDHWVTGSVVCLYRENVERRSVRLMTWGLCGGGCVCGVGRGGADGRSNNVLVVLIVCSVNRFGHTKAKRDVKGG